MHLTHHLPPVIEAKGLEHARATGKAPEKVPLFALAQQHALSAPAPSD